MEEKDYSLELQYAGYMLTDYFSGTSHCMLPIICHNENTVEEIIDLLEQEIYTYYDHLDYLVETKGFNTDKLSNKVDDLITDLKEQNKDRMKDIFLTKAITWEEFENEENEIPVAIFIIKIEGI